MKNLKFGTTLIALILSLGCAIWLLILRQDLSPAFDARQEVMETGATVTGTASYVKHEGLMNWGVRYALLNYEVDGETYQSEVRFAQNYRKLPGEADEAGRYPVVIHYDEKNPQTAAIESAQKGWRLAKASLVFMVILLSLNGIVIAIYLFATGKDSYVKWKLSRF